jgi:hypothetical protein
LVVAKGRERQKKVKMVHGQLEVLLIGAKGLEDTDFLSKTLSSSFFRALVSSCLRGRRFTFRLLITVDL